MWKWPSLSLILSENGLTKDAIGLTEEVVKLRKRKLREDHRYTLGSMYDLAIRYSDVGREDEALKLVEEVVKKSKLREDHPFALRSIHSLANRYREVGRRKGGTTTNGEGGGTTEE